MAKKLKDAILLFAGAAGVAALVMSAIMLAGVIVGMDMGGRFIPGLIVGVVVAGFVDWAKVAKRER